MTPSMWAKLKQYIGTKTGHGKLELLAKMNDIENEGSSFLPQLEVLLEAYKAKSTRLHCVVCDDLLDYAKKNKE